MLTKTIQKRYHQIRIKLETKQRLMEIGEFGESFDDVIRKLLDFYEKHRREKHAT